MKQMQIPKTISPPIVSEFQEIFSMPRIVIIKVEERYSEEAAYRRITEYLKQRKSSGYPHITSLDLHSDLGISIEQASSVIQRLVKEGKLKEEE